MTLRLGVVPWPWSGGGGIYQYSHSVLQALAARGDDCVIVSADAAEAVEAARVFGHYGIEIQVAATPSSGKAVDALKKVVGEGRHRELWRRTRETRSRARRPGPLEAGLVNWKPHLTSMLTDLKVDLVIHPRPTAMSFEARVPYILAIHDLQHRFQPEFPEVSLGRQWETTEYVIRNAVRFATTILTDSEVGKQDVLDFYGFLGIPEERVEVLPFAPSPLLRDPSDMDVKTTRESRQLPTDFLFYPAQFWPHKNHIRIIEALHRLKTRRGLDVPVVFVGSHVDPLMEETWGRVQQLVRTYGLTSQVLFFGYVTDEEMSVLYREARALLMPTFFGPTNIPVVEAWMFGCPVITSDIRGIREHTGDAGYLVDPKSIDEIARGIEEVISNPDLRKRLTAAGSERVGSYGQKEFNLRFNAILDRAVSAVATQGFPE